MQAVLAYQPDVVLIDLSLPGLDGVQVARAIRQQRSLDGVQLIALSQIAEDRFRRQVEDVGFDDYLPKPIDPVHLQELLAANTEALRI
jgi:CheY-like chemotaxis protein